MYLATLDHESTTTAGLELESGRRRLQWRSSNSVSATLPTYGSDVCHSCSRSVPLLGFYATRRRSAWDVWLRGGPLGIKAVVLMARGILPGVVSALQHRAFWVVTSA